MSLDLANTLIYASTCLAALGGVYIAQKQLSSIKNELSVAVKNQRNDSLKIVLEIETQMNSRKLEFDKASKNIREADNAKKSDTELDILTDYFHAVRESYFNSLDRLCFCIDKKYIEDKDWRVEYRNLLNDTIVNYPDDFNESSPYHNMKKINKLWQTS